MPDGAVVSVYSDITDLKASERRLIQARNQAETANLAKSEFLANMNHELRTPLNAIIGFSEIIAHELFGPLGNEKYLDYIKDIHQSSLHLLSIIKDVLDMSKIEAGKLELSRERLNIRSLIGEVIRMMRERAQSRGIKLVTMLADENLEIWADESAMKQIFLNLLSNAIKFSRDGGEVCIRVAAHNPDLAIVEFEDHGIGMNQEELEREPGGVHLLIALGGDELGQIEWKTVGVVQPKRIVAADDTRAAQLVEAFQSAFDCLEEAILLRTGDASATAHVSGKPQTCIHSCVDLAKHLFRWFPRTPRSGAGQPARGMSLKRSI